MKNREEWEACGQDVVATMVKECHQKYGVKDLPEEVPPKIENEVFV